MTMTISQCFFWSGLIYYRNSLACLLCCTRSQLPIASYKRCLHWRCYKTQCEFKRLHGHFHCSTVPTITSCCLLIAILSQPFIVNLLSFFTQLACILINM